MTLITGIVILLAAIGVFLVRAPHAAVWGMGLGFMGLATIFTSMMYWGCGDNSCTPRDN
jgi:hypothetical protein